MVMLSSQTASVANPASVATASFGIPGLPTPHEKQIAPTGRTFTLSEQAQIRGGDSLRPFRRSPLEQVQVLELPVWSMVQWSVSPDALSATITVRGRRADRVARIGDGEGDDV
jgi:hypothetical protein